MLGSSSTVTRGPHLSCISLTRDTWRWPRDVPEWHLVPHAMQLCKMHLHLHWRFCFKAHWRWLLARQFPGNVRKNWQKSMAITWNILSVLWGTKLLSRSATVAQYAGPRCVSVYWLTRDARVLRRWFSKLLRPDVSSSFTPASCQPPLFRDPGTRRLRGKGPPLLHFSININISAFSADCWSTTAHSQLSLGPNFCANLSNDLMVICWDAADAALCISGIPPVTMCHNSGDWAWEARELSVTGDCFQIIKCWICRMWRGQMTECTIVQSSPQSTRKQSPITSICCWFWKLSITHCQYKSI